VRHGACTGALVAAWVLLAANALTSPDTGPSATCRCFGGSPTRLSLTPRKAEAVCGHLDADGNPAFFPLACGGLYFGGAGVGLPLPWALPTSGIGVFNVRCDGTTLTLLPTTAAEIGGTGICTSAGCQLGPPVPVPNGRHGEAGTSACVVARTSEDLSGTADCASGAMSISVALVEDTFVNGDLFPYRCRGGAAPGKGCTTDEDCGPDGSCANDVGRCRAGPMPGAPCVLDDDCGSGGTCESGRCASGRTVGVGCASDGDCDGVDGKCETLIQPCPICNRATRACDGGPRDGLPCEPGAVESGGAGAPSLDCPPSPQNRHGSVRLRGTLETGTTTRIAADLADQANVFCGYCRNKLTNRFSDPAVRCSSNADCAGLRGFTSCGQRTTGAFTPSDAARRIVVSGAPVAALDGPPLSKRLILAGVFCVPPGSSLSDDLAADLPGPAAISLPALVEAADTADFAALPSSSAREHDP